MASRLAALLMALRCAGSTAFSIASSSSPTFDVAARQLSRKTLAGAWSERDVAQPTAFGSSVEWSFGSMRHLAALAVALPALMASRRRSSGRRARGGQDTARGTELATQDKWIADLDLPAFGKEVKDLGERLKKEQGRADRLHLRWMVIWSRTCALIGLSTMWMGPNIISVVALTLWTHSAWTMVGHHVGHGGYNRTDATGRFRGFALGSLYRRIVDWFDWMLPEAWNVEHNQLHHYRLGEEADPDLLERNSEGWTGMDRWMMPIVSIFLWKWGYYASNTYKEMKVTEMQRQGKPFPPGFDPKDPLTLGDLFQGKGKGVVSKRDFFMRVLGPYFIVHFLVLPAPLLFFSPAFYLSGVVNLLLADVLSNIHGYIVVVPNHAGSDLYRFNRGCKPKSPTFFLRAVISSANFRTGGNFNDFLHGWLNYQIEHHCWPDLSMLAYQKGQPELKKICDKYGVPYIQENVFVRTKKALAISLGLSKMRPYPEQYEREEDMMDWSGDGKQKALMAAA
eukprot:CAMPEP_0170645738 /NCGR_PEP_ID=MMETSP0224-20130122/43259_1 /TAXON_ID=285029 /ORGANISM="Togula jolla, Strain CCCM 725" /LENGTH=508 /DNA_ID=CAMNT_0010977013 /DNA_START=38 /DNA_END=1564 /DNA_ORIENTATION=-